MGETPSAPLDLSVCIVSYNTRGFLRECLQSLYEFTQHLSFEVIVVDNHSHDGTPAMLRQDYPEVILIENTGNEGYTRPMNTALQRARGRYRVQLNPDTKLIEDTFGPLVAYMDAHPEAGICTPKVLNRDLTLQKQCRRSAAGPWDTLSYFLGLSRLFPRSKFFSGYLKTYLDENEVHATEAVSGSCMLIRQAVFADIGYLDEQFFAYQEDSDFCLRANQAGWKVMYVPLARIIHFGGQGGSRVKAYQAIYAWHQSYYQYYRKNLAKNYFFLVNLVFYGLMLVKYLLAIIRAFFSQDKVVGTRKP